MIDALIALAEFWGPSLWRASWQGGIVLAAAWAITRWCTFLSPRIHCWIWRLACLKLLVALFWVSPVELALLPPEAPLAPTQAVVLQPMPELGPELAMAHTPHLPDSQSNLEPAPPLPAPLAAAPAAIDLLGMASLWLPPIWLLGVAYCVARTARQWRSVRRLVRSADVDVTARLQQAYHDEARQMGVHRLPRLQLSAQVEGPILVGVWRPTIILPAQCESAFDEAELRLMLAHELAHYQRHDLAWNWLPTVATWLFFFHPLVWLMIRRWSESQEAACDEALIQRRVARPAEYGRLLLKLAASAPANTHTGLAAAGVLGAYRNLERRILTMARVKPFSARRVAFAVCALMLFGAIAIVPWRLVAQEAAPAADKDQPSQLTTGTFVVNQTDEPAQGAAAASSNDPAARQAIEKLKELGANIHSSKGKSPDGPLTVDIGPAFQGTGADLKLLSTLPDVRSLTVNLRAAKASRQELEKLVENKQADPKMLDRPMKEVDAAAIGELKLKRPLNDLALSHLSDATLTKMASLPPCRQLKLYSPSLSAAGWARLARLAGGVQTLTLQDNRNQAPAGEPSATEAIDDEALRCISEISSLKAINLYNADVTDAGLAHLAALDKLETLSPVHCLKLHGAGLANLKHLKKLTIIETPLDTAGVKAIAQLAALDTLLFQPAELAAADVAPLSKLANLRSLNVTTNMFDEEALKKTALGDAILRVSASLPKLEALHVSGIGVSDEGLAALKGPQLRDLWLGALDVTDQGLATLESLKELRHLTLSGTGLTDDSLRHLAGLPALERLRVAHCTIQGKGLASLAKLNRLKSFSIESSPLDDEGALTFAQLPALESLSLTRTKITDQAFATIAKLPKLQSLSLGENETTVAGLFQLRESKSLRQLSAPGLKAPKEELARLKKDLPGVDVETEYQWTYSVLFAGDDEPDEEPEGKITAAAIDATPEKTAAEKPDSTGATGVITSTWADERATGERKISVTGRATNAAGEPIAGADIYLQSTLGGRAQKVAKTVTDAEGKYEIRDFQLSLEGENPRYGGYQIYGVAPGLGFTWQGPRYLHDQDRPTEGPEVPLAQKAEQVYANDKLTADLRFGPTRTLRGRFVNELGNPIADAKVKAFQFRTLASKNVPPEDRYLIRIPEDKVAKTDADGRFAIPGLPEKSVALLQISLPDSGELTVHAATDDSADITPAKDGEGIQVGDLDFKFCKARVQILYGETETPAKGANVGAALNGAEGVYVSGKADDKGIAELVLPPGDYKLGITPDKANAPIEYVSASLPLVVRDAPQEQSTIARIPAGCKLEIEVVDADSGQPIPKIGISNNPSRDNSNLTTGVYWYIVGNLPQTDKDGKVRIGVEPGKRDVAPEPSSGYELVDATNEPVECVAGKTVSLKFKLRKQPKAEVKPEAKPEEEPEPKITGTAILVEREGEKKPKPVAGPAAQKALSRLKELGAEPATVEQIGIQRGWTGTDADLKLLNDLPDLKWLYIEFDKIGAQAVADLKLKRPLENLILYGLSDAILEKIPRLPQCGRLILVQYALTDAGFRLLADRGKGIEFINFDGAGQDEAGGRLFITDESLKQISQMHSLKGLHLSDCKITDAGLASLTALETLEELMLDRCAGVRGAGYANLAPVKSFRRLSLFTQPVGGEAMAAIAKLTQLESLKLAPTGRSLAELKPDDVANLKQLSHLQTLEIFDHASKAKEPLGNALLAAIGQMQSLRSLRLYGVPTSADGVDSLAKANALEDLYLSPVELSERSLTAIEKMTGLKKLGLGGSGVVSDAVLGRLAKFTQLTQLNISGSGINDEGLARLANLRALEMLNLPDSRITGAGLAALTNLKQLKTLTLSDSPLDDEGSQHLRELPTVEWLYLNQTKITDKALAPIATMSKLRQVTLDDTAVTAEGLLELKDLKRLRRVSVAGLKASKEEVARLRAALAKVQLSLKAPPNGDGTGVFTYERDDD